MLEEKVCKHQTDTHKVKVVMYRHQTNIGLKDNEINLELTKKTRDFRRNKEGTKLQWHKFQDVSCIAWNNGFKRNISYQKRTVAFNWTFSDTTRVLKY